MPLLRHQTGIKHDAELLSRNPVDGAVGLDKEI
jgi:hypothetical protein